jgi:hypothetical protein
MVAAWFAGFAQFTMSRDMALAILRGMLVLIAVMAVSAAIIIWVGRWMRRPAAPPGGDDLAYYRLLYEQGEFSREEYERIRARLGKQLRKDLDLPAKEEAPPAAPPPNEPPAS